MPLDINKVRGSFPALSGDQVFLDNAGGSQALGTVADRIRDYLLNTNVQLGATYDASQKSSARYAEGYDAAAKFLNASADEIVLGSATTQLLRNLSLTLHFDEGDELVVSSVDHEANIASWVDLAARQGLVLKWWTPDKASLPNPKLTPENLARLLSERTRLVTLTHASNILGTIHDIKAIAAAAHAKSPRALVVVDAVAYAPHRRVDVKDLGVDFYAFSWYKVYGPHLSLLYGSKAAQKQMKSLGHFFNPHSTLEYKLGLAGSSYELVHAIPAVLEYLGVGTNSTKWDGIIEQERKVQDKLLRYLRSRKDVTIWGEPSSDTALRVATISFTFKGWDSRRAVEAVEAKTNFGIRWGGFYSYRLVRQLLGLGEDGVVRVSAVHYNTVDEMERLIAAFEKYIPEAKAKL